MIAFTGCTSYDVVKIEDKNITYSNFSCKTDTEFGTITTFKHSCSFDIINKNPDDINNVYIEYSYCPSFDKPLSPCQEKGSISIEQLKLSDIIHKNLVFTDYLVDDTSLNKRTFQFKVIKTVYIKSN